MNIIDTSGWLEYFSDGKNADFFEKPILDKRKKIIIPAIILYEIFKKILIESGEHLALEIVGQLQTCQIEDIDSDITLSAAKISSQYQMPMADSIIYAVALKYNAILWTQDAHFKKLANVKYIKKKK